MEWYLTCSAFQIQLQPMLHSKYSSALCVLGCFALVHFQRPPSTHRSGLPPCHKAERQKATCHCAVRCHGLRVCIVAWPPLSFATLTRHRAPYPRRRAPLPPSPHAGPCRWCFCCASWGSSAPTTTSVPWPPPASSHARLQVITRAHGPPMDDDASLVVPRPSCTTTRVRSAAKAPPRQPPTHKTLVPLPPLLPLPQLPSQAPSKHQACRWTRPAALQTQPRTSTTPSSSATCTRASLPTGRSAAARRPAAPAAPTPPPRSSPILTPSSSPSLTPRRPHPAHPPPRPPRPRLRCQPQPRSRPQPQPRPRPQPRPLRKPRPTPQHRRLCSQPSPVVRRQWSARSQANAR